MGLRNLIWLTMVVGTAICGLWMVAAHEELEGEWVELDAYPDEKYPDEDELSRAKRAIQPPPSSRQGGKASFTHDSCFNVSRWGPVEYINVTRKKCDTTFAKECENLTDTVCAEVPGVFCEIVGYPECNMTMGVTEYNDTKPDSMPFQPWECKNFTKPVPHTKMVPECWNETRKNCLTEWQQLPDGTEVWDPQGGPCETVTWQRCELRPKPVLFKQPFVECRHGNPIIYNGYKTIVKERPVNGMTCEPKHTLNCRSTISSQCKKVTFMNCVDKPQQDCRDVTIRKPHQKFLHRKKCLLPDPNDPHAAEDAAARSFQAGGPAITQTFNTGRTGRSEESSAVVAERAEAVVAPDSE